MGLQEKLEMELKKQTDEAASKVAAVLQRAEEQGIMIESLHTSVSLYGLLFFDSLVFFFFFSCCYCLFLHHLYNV